VNDRCANRLCRTSVDLEWNAVGCQCGEAVTCESCDPIEACEECRADRFADRAMEAAAGREPRTWFSNGDSLSALAAEVSAMRTRGSV